MLDTNYYNSHDQHDVKSLGKCLDVEVYNNLYDESILEDILWLYKLCFTPECDYIVSIAHHNKLEIYISVSTQYNLHTLINIYFNKLFIEYCIKL